MQVHNMLEKNGSGYINGNIRLVRIKPAEITVHLRDGGTLTYQKIDNLNTEKVGEYANNLDKA